MFLRNLRVSPNYTALWPIVLYSSWLSPCNAVQCINLLLALASTVIIGFGSVRTRDQICVPSNTLYMFANGSSSSAWGSSDHHDNLKSYKWWKNLHGLTHCVGRSKERRKSLVWAGLLKNRVISIAICAWLWYEAISESVTWIINYRRKNVLIWSHNFFLSCYKRAFFEDTYFWKFGDSNIHLTYLMHYLSRRKLSF
jgi:hypothetical protein